MQKIFLLLILLFTGGFAIGQTIPPGSCGLLYTYDAAGNRTKQEYFCNNTSGPIDMRIAQTNAPTAVEKEETGFAKVDALYPNPTTGRFTVRFAKDLNNTQILITDINGRIIQQVMGNGSMVEFDLSNQAAGVYYVVVRTGKESITQKVIKL